jgi:hypothetical protein
MYVVVRAKTFVAENQGFDVLTTQVPVIGGHAGNVTVCSCQFLFFYLPILSYPLSASPPLALNARHHHLAASFSGERRQVL